MELFGSHCWELLGEVGDSCLRLQTDRSRFLKRGGFRHLSWPLQRSSFIISSSERPGLHSTSSPALERTPRWGQRVEPVFQGSKGCGPLQQAGQPGMWGKEVRGAAPRPGSHGGTCACIPSSAWCWTRKTSDSRRCVRAFQTHLSVSSITLTNEMEMEPRNLFQMRITNN